MHDSNRRYVVSLNPHLSDLPLERRDAGRVDRHAAQAVRAGRQLRHPEWHQPWTRGAVGSQHAGNELSGCRKNDLKVLRQPDRVNEVYGLPAVLPLPSTYSLAREKLELRTFRPPSG